MCSVEVLEFMHNNEQVLEHDHGSEELRWAWA